LITKNWRKEIKLKNFLDQKLQFTCFQATGEAFSPQKETDSGTPMKSGYNPDPDGNPDPQEKSFLFLSAGCFLLRTEDFSCSLDVNYGGQLEFLHKKIHNTFFQL
jgi:hypothetical protein